MSLFEELIDDGIPSFRKIDFSVEGVGKCSAVGENVIF